MDEAEKDAIRKDFNAAVNMAPAELNKWLASEHSQKFGWPKDRDEGEESVGHQSGQRIIEIKRKPKAELTDDDYQHMRKVVGYVHRHLAQRPSGDISETPWRFSLMNWGHDPLND
ncbi:MULTISPECIES: DUF3140 domain-containing protein [unclassified Devosia]|uniref:DUF3140 domain-containing protein n=1 Tax=unclassified Devosia TaxID=196773 RepID=UPI0015518919|nr:MULTISPECIES: DUF3140 domain-containing protein [unclassified Devosia]